MRDGAVQKGINPAAGAVKQLLHLTAAADAAVAAAWKDCLGCTAAASHSALARLNYCCLFTGGGADAGAGFLLWELSTPFVHLRWLLHKSGRDKQRIYAVNGLLMAVVFFLCRPVWGTWLSYKVCGHINAVCRHVLV